MKKLGRTGQGYLLNTIIIVLLFTAAQLVTAALGGEGSFKLVLVPSIWQCCYLMILAASLNLVLGFWDSCPWATAALWQWVPTPPPC